MRICGSSGPPELWAAATDEVALVRVLGEMIAAALGWGDWRPKILWRSEIPSGPTLVSDDLDRAARAAGIPFAYTRSQPDGGSVTVFLPREQRSGSPL